MRRYREELGIAQDALAQLLRVSPTKLRALENDQLDQLPDAVFARALTLAVCRHLKVDAKPVLDLLPQADASRLAVHDERGLDYPLDRPSFLPQSALASVVQFFNPMRAAALLVFAAAVVLFVFTDSPSQPEVKESVGTVTTSVAVPSTSASEASVPEQSVQQGNMVVTSVHSPAIAAAASAAAAQATSGASDAR